MLSVNRMLNTEQEHHYDKAPLYSSPSCHSLPPPPPRSSMLDIANLLCRDDDEDDTNSQLTTPCLSVTSSPMASHTKLNPPSFINLSNLDQPSHPQQSQFEHNDDHLSTSSITSPLTPPLRSSPYYYHHHQSSLSSDTLYNNSKKVTTDYHYQHKLMFTTADSSSTTSSNSENHPSDNMTNEEEHNNSNSIKAKRRRATNKQLQVLQSVFEHTFFPSTHVRSQLGRQLGMSPRTVQIWFQNRRQALRTKEKRNGNSGLL